MKKPIEQQWPASKTELWAIDRIVPYDKNPRTHPEAQITLLAKSMVDDGVTAPILVDEAGVIIYGHGRRLAAIKNGFPRYPVIIARGWSEEKKRAVRIKDNATALMSGWDQTILVAEIGDLKLAGYDVKLLGFGDAALRSFDPAPAGDTVPEPKKNPTSRLGDLWHLGNHRLICGDATDPETWKRFGPAKAAMAFTDPPYGVSYEADGFEVIEGDKKRRDALYGMLVKALRNMAQHAIDAAAFYIWHASSTREDFAQAMKAAGLVERQYLMWVKPTVAFGRADYQWQHEPCQPAGTMVDKVVAAGQGRGRPSIVESVPIENFKARGSRGQLRLVCREGSKTRPHHHPIR